MDLFEQSTDETCIYLQQCMLRYNLSIMSQAETPQEHYHKHIERLDALTESFSFRNFQIQMNIYQQMTPRTQEIAQKTEELFQKYLSFVTD